MADPIGAQLPLRVREVEEDRAGRCQKESGVRDREEEALALVPRKDDRVNDDREEQEEHVGHVVGEVKRRLQLHGQRSGGAPDLGKELPRDLDRALHPTVLLRLERVHLDRKLGRAAHLRREDEPPSAELGPVAEVEILRQRIGLPSARVHDAFRRTPAVPLKLKNRCPDIRAECSMRK